MHGMTNTKILKKSLERHLRFKVHDIFRVETVKWLIKTVVFHETTNILELL